MWTVMRCSNKETINLSRMGAAYGVEVFAPYLTLRIRVPRTHRFVTKEIPIMGTFLFIPLGQADLASEVFDRHAKPMLINGANVAIQDQEMAAMRSEIYRRMPKQDRIRQGIAPSRARKVEERTAAQLSENPDIKVGQFVKVVSGVFSNYRAKVIAINNDGVDVEFESFFGRARFSTFLLSPYEG